MGATISKVASLKAVHRRGRPGLPGAPDGSSLLAAILDDGKHFLGDTPRSISELEQIVVAGTPETGRRPFDLIVVDRIGGPPYGIAEVGPAADYLRWAQNHIRVPLVSVTAFGLTGIRCDDVATELTLNAACGMLSAVRDAHTGVPMKLAGYQVLLSAAGAAALAGCHALDLSRGVAPTHIEVSAQESGIATGPLLAVTHLLLDCKGLFGEKRYGAPSSFFPCRDGLIRISAMEEHQWSGLVRAMGTPRGPNSSRRRRSAYAGPGMSIWSWAAGRCSMGRRASRTSCRRRGSLPQLCGGRLRSCARHSSPPEAPSGRSNFAQGSRSAP